MGRVLLLSGWRLYRLLLVGVDIVLAEGDGVSAQFEPVDTQKTLQRL